MYSLVGWGFDPRVFLSFPRPGGSHRVFEVDGSSSGGLCPQTGDGGLLYSSFLPPFLFLTTHNSQLSTDNHFYIFHGLLLCFPLLG